MILEPDELKRVTKIQHLLRNKPLGAVSMAPSGTHSRDLHLPHPPPSTAPKASCGDLAGCTHTHRSDGTLWALIVGQAKQRFSRSFTGRHDLNLKS